MNKKLISLVVVVLVVAGAFYYLKNPVAAPGTSEESTTSMDHEMPNPVTIALGELNGSGQSGVATFAEVEGKVHVGITLSGAKSSVPQPAHIHIGSCPGVGAVKYPLTAVINGTSETMLSATMQDLLSEPLAINVHKSADDLKTYVACGTIRDADDFEGSASTESNAAAAAGSVSGAGSAAGGGGQAVNAKTFDISASNFSFSMKEIRVKKGDTVRINFKNDMGFHDWVIDEFNARTKQISAGATDSVTFVADKAGSFEYYCSVGSHRQMGMKGTLIVE